MNYANAASISASTRSLRFPAMLVFARAKPCAVENIWSL